MQKKGINFLLLNGKGCGGYIPSPFPFGQFISFSIKSEKQSLISQKWRGGEGEIKGGGDGGNGMGEFKTNCGYFLITLLEAYFENHDQKWGKIINFH